MEICHDTHQLILLRITFLATAKTKPCNLNLVAIWILLYLNRFLKVIAVHETEEHGIKTPHIFPKLAQGSEKPFQSFSFSSFWVRGSKTSQSITNELVLYHQL